MSVREWVNRIGGFAVALMVANAAIHWLSDEEETAPAVASAVVAKEADDQSAQAATTHAVVQPVSPDTSVSSDSPREDRLGLKLLESQQLFGAVCDTLKDPVVFDRVKGTASANNHPAYVLGYRFSCVSNFGSELISVHIGWMEKPNTSNPDTAEMECIHHNSDKSRVVGEGWHYCGGNFRQI